MTKKTLKTIGKIVISLLLFYLVFTKIDINQVATTYKQCNPTYIVLGIVFFVLSQLVSSFRLNYIFHQNDFLLSQRSNLKLYFVGMFYNFFIPGGIGGDAYKVFILKNKFGWNTKQLTKCVFIDRLIGLLAILFILVISASYIFFSEKYIIFIGTLLALFGGCIAYFILYKIFTNTKKIYILSFLYSIVIQLLQLATIFCIIKSLPIDGLNFINYGFIFLISSVLSVVSFAGFGAREYVFLKASEFLATQESIATSIGLSFNIITALIALAGLFFIITKLNLTLKKS